MAISVDLIVGATTYNLNDLVSFKIVGEDGFGLPPSHLITNRSPLQDGDSFVDFRLDPRYISLVIWDMGQTETLHYSQRDTLIRALKLSTTGIKLRYTLTDGTIYQIDCYYDRGLDFSTRSRKRWLQKNTFSLYCPDPLFYDPAGKSMTFAQVGGGDTFEIPHAVPHQVGASTLNDTKVIQYAGTWGSFPHLIRITGPITNPVITNTTLGKKLDFTGITIGGGSYYDIDLRFNYKTIVNESETNKIADLTDDSDLVDWYLGAHQEVPGGNNSINAAGTNATVATKVDISYNENFVGL